MSTKKKQQLKEKSFETEMEKNEKGKEEKIERLLVEIIVKKTLREIEEKRDSGS